MQMYAGEAGKGIRARETGIHRRRHPPCDAMGVRLNSEASAMSILVKWAWGLLCARMTVCAPTPLWPLADASWKG